MGGGLWAGLPLAGVDVPRKMQLLRFLGESWGWVAVSRRILHGSAEPGLGFLFYPANFHERLQHMSHISIIALLDLFCSDA